MITSEYALVLTTFPANSEAVADFARALVAERLAACDNILGPMGSIYAWKGKIEQDQERQIVIKTTRGRIEVLRARVHELHPYEVPEFLVIPVVRRQRGPATSCMRERFLAPRTCYACQSVRPHPH